MQIKRRKSRLVLVRGVAIGAGNPVVIQSMTKTKSSDVEATLRQINSLNSAGCQIVRLAIKDFDDAKALKQIKKHSVLPLVADIHFDRRLAIAAIENGADKIRLNPGNIGQDSHIREVVSALKSAKIPLRIGLNSGSVAGVKSRAGLSMADKLVKAALGYIKKIEEMKFRDIVVSLKANNVLDTVEAYRKIAKLCDYPLHLGVTATGAAYQGLIKSSIALGALLLEGIGDTIRVSLTDDPRQEVRAAKGILESLGERDFGVQLISCPTCGRCQVDLVDIVKKLELQLAKQEGGLSGRPLKVAVMGCVVNGPGEAKEADMGIAFGKGQGLFFKRGRPVKKISVKECVAFLLKEIKKA
ncbi:MAG: flavodoxin-dependent (E)-4-hydroxy-3-methylbut-2-enyl-diphosphate synthase [Candidatus Omnitrophota bacterium]